ncbi:MAG TPA: VOC family protein [Aquihabitans sp.]|nr:VOC family protein [Aquihabitans sp.]
MANLGDIVQVGYLTADIEAAMATWVERSGVGPFTWYQHVRLDAVHEGEPTSIEMEVAIAYRGDVQIELIQQTNDAPSPYRECFRDGRLGMHHLAFGTRDMAASLDAVRADGFEVVCTIDAAMGRYAYVRDPALPEVLFELLGADAGIEAMWARDREAARTWDGVDPIRPIDLAGL